MTLEFPASTTELFQALGTALGLGLLVGLQREWAQKKIAGIRTCALVSLLGALSGLVGGMYGSWIVPVTLVCCVVVLVLGNLAALKSEKSSGGTTTEMAVLLLFLIGVLCVTGQTLVAATCAGTLMVLLQSKTPLHGLVRRIGEDELREIARLVLIGLVILPLLPNREMGYLGVFNPFKVWLMVVLIVGISLLAHLAGKFLGGSRGTLVAGILGGLISSTATTVSAARRSKARDAASHALAVVIMIASAVVFVRVLVEVWLTAPNYLQTVAPPLAVLLAWACLVAGGLWIHARRTSVTHPGQEEVPSEFKSAVVFALLYVGVLYGVAFAKQHLGDAGLYAVAGLSGLTDMDAITLSTGSLIKAGHVDPHTGWRVIMVGGMANLAFKGVLVAALGSRKLLKPSATGFAALLAGAGVLLAVWP